MSNERPILSYGKKRPELSDFARFLIGMAAVVAAFLAFFSLVAVFFELPDQQ